MTKFIKTIFKWGNCMDFFTHVSKTASFNAIIKDMQKRAANNDFSVSQERMLQDLFGESMGDAIADFQAGAWTDNTALYAHAVLGKWIPQGKSQESIVYRNHPNGRIFYQFKKFLVVQVSGIRDTALRDMAEGIRRKDARIFGGGFRRLIGIALSLLLLGLPLDMFRAFIAGRQFVLDDSVYSRLLGMIGLSPYIYRTAKRDGPVKALISFVIPAGGSLAANIQTDVQEWVKLQEAGSDMELSDFLLTSKTWETAPIFGRLYSEWFGRRADENQEQRDLNEDGFFILTNGKKEEPKRKSAASQRKAEARELDKLEKKHKTN
jgi:hypothetical protein